MNADLSMFSLEGFTVVVAGASRGIGYSLAQGLAKAGATVIGFGRSEDVEAEHFYYQRCDINSASDVAALFDSVESAHSKIDAYIHVAGITLPSTAIPQSVETFRATLDINLTSAYRCCADIGQRMARRRRGSIVTVTSIGALQGFPGNPGYVAAKGGLRMMSKALALDLGNCNVRVNSLMPGYIQTDMTAGSYDDPVRRQERAQRTMLGRWGQSGDLIGAAIFLASDASAYVTGTDLIVDGGWTAKGL